MISPFEKAFFTKLHAMYSQRADNLVHGTVPTDRYQIVAGELRVLREVFKLAEAVRDEINEGK